MKASTYSAFGTLALLVAACGGDGGGRAPGAQGPGPATPGGGSGAIGAGGSQAGSTPTPGAGQNPGGAPGSGGQTSATGGRPDFTASCADSKAGKPVLRLLTRAELDRTLTDVFPALTGDWTNSMPASSVSALGFDNDASAVVGAQLAEKLLETAESIGAAVTGAKLATVLPCAASGGDRACAADFVARYGRRLFRRPLSEAESDRYLTFFDGALAKSDFKTALKWLTVGLIQSPNAVYRSEVGALGGGVRTLNQHEIATELAYTYTGSTPSEELLAQADGNAIADPASVAKSLLQTEPGKAAFQRFFEAYVGYPRVASVSRERVPEFAAVSSDMIEETRRFIDATLLQQSGGVRELLVSPTTNPSIRLAEFYGFTRPSADYASVERAPGQGIGLLAQGSFLSTKAAATTSSPTQRGLFVYSRLLCRQPPHAPDTVPPLAEAMSTQSTTRQRYELSHAQGPCAGCHKLFDPIGFGFEHFDEAGRYRAQENGVDIDSASKVPALDGTDLFTFTDQESLVTQLVERPEVYQCFAGYLATYAFGSSESCLGAGQVEPLRAGSEGIADAFANLAAEPHFTKRSSQ